MPDCFFVFEDTYDLISGAELLRKEVFAFLGDGLAHEGAYQGDGFVLQAAEEGEVEEGLGDEVFGVVAPEKDAFEAVGFAEDVFEVSQQGAPDFSQIVPRCLVGRHVVVGHPFLFLTQPLQMHNQLDSTQMPQPLPIELRIISPRMMFEHAQYFVPKMVLAIYGYLEVVRYVLVCLFPEGYVSRF
jgi:hypothetical protein